MPPFVSRNELSEGLFAELFCSYCGCPPRGGRRERYQRVCSHCKLGMVLRTLPGAAPGLHDPFVIVDERLTVQAISRQAETVLMVDEPAGVGVPLDSFLISDSAGAEGMNIADLVALVKHGTLPAEMPEVRTVGDPQIRFQARIAGCGPPLAALLVLKPVQEDRPATSNGRAAANGTARKAHRAAPAVHGKSSGPGVEKARRER